MSADPTASLATATAAFKSALEAAIAITGDSARMDESAGDGSTLLGLHKHFFTW
jgi:hypothetical protein